MALRLQLVLTLMAVLIGSGGLAAQSANDTRTQYPRLLANSYASLSVGAVDYLFTPHQLQPGFRVGSIDTPHLTARVVLFGHEFNRFVSVQGSYTRPVKYVSYQNVNGAPGTDHHHVRVNFGSVTLKTSAPIAKRLWLYGEGGLGITSRTGFVIAGVPAVTDAHFSSLVVGGGFDYHLNRRWDLTAGLTYSPGRASVDQRRSILSSGGVRYTMRALDAVQVAASRDSGFIFPRQVIQMEYSFGSVYSVNDFVSTKVPIFWGGNAKVDIGVAPHYERNVFHTRRIFALDFGTSAGVYMTRQKDDRFFTASVYPLFRFTFLHARWADVYFAYSVAGPTYISKVLLDNLDTGRHFTFQDFMGIGLFAGSKRHLNLGVKINHFSNGNIFTQNAGVTVPLTVSAGYAF
jgi:Lipid A 3-O-deacylase (PagL)